MLGTSLLKESNKPLSSLIKSNDVIRVIAPALAKPLKFQVLLDN